MSDLIRWNERYQCGETPWDTGNASSELVRVVTEARIVRCRCIELGCGSGTNAVWLAQQGFDVTAVDGSTLAIERARHRAELGSVFEIVKLREFYFDQVERVGVQFLAWSSLLRRRAD